MTTAPAAPDERRVRFERVVGEVLAPLQRYLRRRAPAEMADDALGDTLLVLWRRLDDVPPDAALPWTYGVARRCLANQQRAGRRHLRLVARVGGQLAPHAVSAPPADDAYAGDPALEAAFGTLSVDDRELLQLWAWEQLEPQDIATVLGVTPNAVSIRLHRARTRLGRAVARKDMSGKDMSGKDMSGKDMSRPGHSSLGLAEEH